MLQVSLLFSKVLNLAKDNKKARLCLAQNCNNAFSQCTVILNITLNCKS